MRETTNPKQSQQACIRPHQLLGSVLIAIILFCTSVTIIGVDAILLFRPDMTVYPDMDRDLHLSFQFIPSVLPFTQNSEFSIILPPFIRN
jgi:hypothetical protein